MWIYWNASIFRLVLDSSVRIVAAAGAVTAILLVARIRSSSLQHQAWTVVLGAMLAMPVLSAVVPSVQVPDSVAVLVDKVPEVESIARTTTRIASESGSRSTIPVPATSSIVNGFLPEHSLWPLAILIVYTAGLLGLLFRLGLGWLGMRRLLRSCCAEFTPGGPAVLESDLVSTPLTCGIVHPRIVLPRSWKEWPAEKLHAVLVHERAHIERWDARVAFFAQLNRAIFWFHPLAWWLERKLALLAEQACDDAVVHETGEPARYAETLVEIASAVHRRGGRFSWQGIGVAGNGILQSRIHRLLRGNFLQNVSPLRKASIAVLCFASVGYVAGAHAEIMPAQSQIASFATAPAAARTAQGWVDRKAQFRPPNSKFPQIIQDSDYSSIEAIEDLYRLLENTGRGSSNSFGRSAVWRETPDGLSVNGTSGKPVRFQIQSSRVIIGKDVFEQKKTILLFSTFLKVLNAFAGPDCRDVKFTSLSTRAYKNRTVIEFGCSDEVLTLESFSNGPSDEERLYILDIIKEQDSLMFGTFPRRMDQASMPRTTNIQASSAPEVPANPSPQARTEAIPAESLEPPAKVSADSLNIVRDALTNAADNLLKSANQSDYVQKAIALLDQALDDAKEAAAHVNDDSAAAAPTVIPTFDAAPPPAPLTNFTLYSSLNSLKFAYDALNRVPGGDFGGYRTRINNDIAAVAEVLVKGIASYNARHPQ